MAGTFGKGDSGLQQMAASLTSRGQSRRSGHGQFRQATCAIARKRTSYSASATNSFFRMLEGHPYTTAPSLDLGASLSCVRLGLPPGSSILSFSMHRFFGGVRRGQCVPVHIENVFLQILQRQRAGTVKWATSPTCSLPQLVQHGRWVLRKLWRSQTERSFSRSSVIGTPRSFYDTTGRSQFDTRRS